MGISGLHQALKPYMQPVHISALRGQVRGRCKGRGSLSKPLLLPLPSPCFQMHMYPYHVSIACAATASADPPYTSKP